LLTLGAEVAMKAGKIDAALAYLDRTNEFLAEKRNEMDRAKPDDKDDLQNEFILKFNQRIISSCALPLTERLNAGDAPENVFVDALAPHKAVLRGGPIKQKRDVTVAIIGGVPQRELIGYPLESVGHWVPGKYGLDNFADTIGLIVSTLAPDAKLLFVPLGEKSSAHSLLLLANEDEIGEAVRTAVAKANIVLIPFAARNYRLRFETVLRHANDAVIVVPALSKAIQERLPKATAQVASIPALFVASGDVDGRFKGALLSSNDELTSYPGAVWAPGMRIPRLTGDGMWSGCCRRRRRRQCRGGLGRPEGAGRTGRAAEILAAHPRRSPFRRAVRGPVRRPEGRRAGAGSGRVGRAGAFDMQRGAGSGRGEGRRGR
jgi:hypothetical protein